jgi:hypothetical protein
MKLVERFRRWWNPAQWRDDHPGEHHGQSDTPPAQRRARWAPWPIISTTKGASRKRPAAALDRVDVESDPKRPKH